VTYMPPSLAAEVRGTLLHRAEQSIRAQPFLFCLACGLWAVLVKVVL
jgi:hypothetical protein